MAEPYHLHRPEKEITDNDEINRIIHEQLFMTLAMCRKNQPYLVTLNYGYDQDTSSLFFHCTNEGKKLDYLRTNPKVWGQILDDRGYVNGACDYAYRCVEFEGTVDFPETFEDKKHAFDLMVDQIEPEPEALKQRMVTEDRISKITIGRIRITYKSAKKNER